MTNVERIATVAAAAREVLLPDVLTVEDLARVLHVCPSAVRAMIRAGRLPASKLGRRWLVARVELLRLLTPSHVTPRFTALPPVKETAVLPSGAPPAVPDSGRPGGNA